MCGALPAFEVDPATTPAVCGNANAVRGVLKTEHTTDVTWLLFMRVSTLPCGVLLTQQLAAICVLPCGVLLLSFYAHNPTPPPLPGGS